MGPFYKLMVEHILVYWLCSFFIMKSQKCNLKPTKHILNVLFNQVIVTSLALHYSGLCKNSNFSQPYILGIRDVFLSYVLQCVSFYILHRMLHCRKIYRYIHALHHSYVDPVPWSAFYCHPLEHLFANLLPISLGPLILGMNIHTIRLWTFLATVNTVIAHSGSIMRPFTPGTHDLHHSNFNVNYGTGAWMDKLCGTFYDEVNNQS
jgi:sterol desaturase/sphingolipid hydroxylase (fatty acid hydroxylase superfamily)